MTQEKDIIEGMATLKQAYLDTDRRIESYHASIANYEIMRREEKKDIKEYVGDQIKIAIGDIKEHINKVGAAQRQDIQANRNYCEAENISLFEAIAKLKGKMDRVSYGAAGAMLVIGILAWAVNTFAK